MEALQWECVMLLDTLTNKQVAEVQEMIIGTFGTLEIGIEQIPWICLISKCLLATILILFIAKKTPKRPKTKK